MPAANTPAIDNRKVEAAAKRAAKKAAREFAAAHNAKIVADCAALAAHIAQWGEDGFETA